MFNGTRQIRCALPAQPADVGISSEPGKLSLCISAAFLFYLFNGVVPGDRPADRPNDFFVSDRLHRRAVVIQSKVQKCLICHFGEYDKGRVFINSDICATAKGYEYIAYTKLSKNGGAV